VTVICSEAAEIARNPDSRGSFDGIMTRSFGIPPLVAEISGSLLKAGGRLVVSEPPEVDARWPPEGVAKAGLKLRASLIGPPRFVVLERLPGEVPLCRTWSRMRRRPLF